MLIDVTQKVVVCVVSPTRIYSYSGSRIFKKALKVIGCDEMLQHDPHARNMYIEGNILKTPYTI